MLVTMNTAVLCDLRPGIVVHRYFHIWGKYCLLLQKRRVAYYNLPSWRWNLHIQEDSILQFSSLWNTNWEIRKSFLKYLTANFLPRTFILAAWLGHNHTAGVWWGGGNCKRKKRGHLRIAGGNSFSFLPSDWKRKKKKGIREILGIL
jgi:hypothetical protein